MKEKRRDYTVQSLYKALNILETLVEGPTEGMTIIELSRKLNLASSTVHRFMTTLSRSDYIEKDPKTAKYKVGCKLVEVGLTALSKIKLREQAHPVLKELAEKTGETVYLMVPHKDEALCLERIDGHHYLKALILDIGGRMPLHIGAGPKVLLAHFAEEKIDKITKTKGLVAYTKNSITNINKLKQVLRQIRKEGYAISYEEVTEDSASIGAPIKDFTEKVVGAVSIAGISTHFTPSKAPRLVQLVKQAANRISRRLGSKSSL